MNLPKSRVFGIKNCVKNCVNFKRFEYANNMTNEKLEKFLFAQRAHFEVDVFGKSVFGQKLYYAKKICDKNLPWVLIVGGMHAREHLSTNFVCHLMKKCKRKKFPFNLCFVPLCNPDGAQLCTFGTKGLPPCLREKLQEINGGKDFSLYKANANGVDLNNNWDANWQTQFSDKTGPSSQGFYGFAPMTEPEVLALAKLTEFLQPTLAISFHLKGEEIYFDFFQDEKRFLRDQKIAQIFASSNGYDIKPTQNNSSGGFKDWCVQKLKIPALTIELGNDKFCHPFPKSQLCQICRKNKNFFTCVKKSLKICQSFAEDVI